MYYVIKTPAEHRVGEEVTEQQDIILLYIYFMLINKHCQYVETKRDLFPGTLFLICYDPNADPAISP
jgi:hypothetical protein